METQIKYQITTVSDFVNVVTAENIDGLLTDFRNFLTMVKINANPNMPFNTESFNWTDDGKNDFIVDLKKNNWTTEETDGLIREIFPTVPLDGTNYKLEMASNNVTNGKIIFELPK